MLVIVLVLIWALRLGFFLFIRVLKAGEDRRFREVKQKFSGFLVWWTLSALWVFLTTVNALVMIINNVSYHDDYYFYFGLVVWIAGFSFEVIADEQKRRFRSQLSNKDQFISTGLWSISRHPNYFGEILEWVGWAIATWSLAGLSFALWTIANLAPRARSNHQWYQENFSNYPKKRKRLIPGVW